MSQFSCFCGICNRRHYIQMTLGEFKTLATLKKEQMKHFNQERISAETRKKESEFDVLVKTPLKTLTDEGHLLIACDECVPMKFSNQGESYGI